jgi:hypothetical protein
VKVWNKNFNTPDFETTRNNAHDTFEQFVCYTDGSKLKNQTGYKLGTTTGQASAGAEGKNTRK